MMVRWTSGEYQSELDSVGRETYLFNFASGSIFLLMDLFLLKKCSCRRVGAEIMVLLFHWKIKGILFPKFENWKFYFDFYILSFALLSQDLLPWLWHFATHYSDTYKWMCHEVCIEMYGSCNLTFVKSFIQLNVWPISYSDFFG